MTKLPISAIVITLNEEKNMADCLGSIHGWVDEIFVVDSGSTDRTIELAKRYTDKICHHEFENFAAQRNWAQDTLPIKNEWVLHLDADERVSAKLAEDLKQIFSAPVEADGIMAPRETVFRGKMIRFGGHYPVYQLRLFRKDKGRSEERMYDQNYIVNGKTVCLKGGIVNIINPDLSEWKARHKRWAKLEAQEVFNKDRVMKMGLDGSPIERRNWLRYNLYYRLPLFIRPCLYFFYRYILRLGFLDGVQGTVFHFWQGFWYRMLVDSEIYKIRKKR